MPTLGVARGQPVSNGSPPYARSSEQTVPLTSDLTESDTESGSVLLAGGTTPRKGTPPEGAVYLSARRPRRGLFQRCWRSAADAGRWLLDVSGIEKVGVVRQIEAYVRENKESVLLGAGGVLGLLLLVWVVSALAHAIGPGGGDVDCQWSSWTEWSVCSVACGDGSRTRTRTVVPKPLSAGQDACPGPRTGTRSCTQPCIYDASISKVSVHYLARVRNLDVAQYRADPSLQHTLEAQLSRALSDAADVDVEDVETETDLVAGKVHFTIFPTVLGAVKHLQESLADPLPVEEAMEDAFVQHSELTAATIGPVDVDIVGPPVVHVPHEREPTLVDGSVVGFTVGIADVDWGLLEGLQGLKPAAEAVFRNSLAESAGIESQDVDCFIQTPEKQAVFQVPAEKMKSVSAVEASLRSLAVLNGKVSSALHKSKDLAMLKHARLVSSRAPVVVFSVKLEHSDHNGGLQHDPALTKKLEGILAREFAKKADIEEQEVTVQVRLAAGRADFQVLDEGLGSLLRRFDDVVEEGGLLSDVLAADAREKPELADASLGSAGLERVTIPVIAFWGVLQNIDAAKIEDGSVLKARLEDALGRALAAAAGIRLQEVRVRAEPKSRSVMMEVNPEDDRGILRRIQAILADGRVFTAAVVESIKSTPALLHATFGPPHMDSISKPVLAKPRVQKQGAPAQVVKFESVIRTMDPGGFDADPSLKTALEGAVRKVLAEKVNVEEEEITIYVNPITSGVVCEIEPKDLNDLVLHLQRILDEGVELNRAFADKVANDPLAAAAATGDAAVTPFRKPPLPVVTFSASLSQFSRVKLQADPKLSRKLKAVLRKAVVKAGRVYEEDVTSYLDGFTGRVDWDVAPASIANLVKELQAAVGSGEELSRSVDRACQEDSAFSGSALKRVRLVPAKADVAPQPAGQARVDPGWSGEGSHVALPPLPAAPSGPQPIKARLRPTWVPGKCLDIAAGLGKAGNVLWVWDCNDSRDMLFLLDTFHSPGSTRIRWATFPELCLNAPGGKQLMIWPCEKSTQANIMWKVPEDGQGPIRLASRPNECITLPAGKETYNNKEWYEVADCGAVPEAKTQFAVEFVDCLWGDWSTWSTCSVGCGGGERVRRARGSSALVRGFEASHCAGELRETMPCNRQSCGAHSPEMLIEPLAVRLHYEHNPSLCLAVGGKAAPAAYGQEAGQEVMFMVCADSDVMLFEVPSLDVGPIRWRKQSQDCLNAMDGELNHQVQMYDCNLSPPSNLNWTLQDAGDYKKVCLTSRPDHCLIAPPGGAGKAVSVGPCGGAGQRDCATFEAQSVECDWDIWSGWSACSTDCGGGNRTRSRRHISKTIASCIPDLVEDQVAPCNPQECQ